MKYLLIILLITACNSSVVTTTETSVAKEAINETIPDVAIDTFRFNDFTPDTLVFVPKEFQRLGKVEYDNGKVKGKIDYNIKWDARSKDIKVIFDTVQVFVARETVNTIHKTTKKPYCNKKLYMLIGFGIGLGLMILIRRILR